jgi:HAD superfamily hydrolase (TIGR01450 family)
VNQTGDGGPDSGPLLAAYDGLICDLDGVVYRGSQAVPGAPEVLHRAIAEGLRLVYATNNASRAPAEVVAQLTGLGAPASLGSVVTSAQTGAVRVLEAVGAGQRVVALGGPGVTAALAEQGLVPVPPKAVSAAAVLQGYGRDLTVSDFASAARHLARGVPWMATNGDLTLPVEWGVAPGNGAYVELLSSVVGRRPDAVTGKPAAALYDLAVKRLSVPRERVLTVGDRLDTDIDGAEAARLHSAWVLTGIHRPSAIVARRGALPTYVLASLRDLLEPYAATRRTDRGWVCGAFVGTVESAASGGASLSLARAPRAGEALRDVPRGEPLPIEAVRAGLAALLDARGNGRVDLAELVRAAQWLDEGQERQAAEPVA